MDANALEPPQAGDGPLVQQFQELIETCPLSIAVPHSVRDEIAAAGTPDYTKRAYGDLVFTYPVELTHDENERLLAVQELMRGQAMSGKHAADATHLFEAAKYGGRYFITHDQRIIRRANEIRSLVDPHIAIVTLREFMSICRHHHLI